MTTQNYFVLTPAQRDEAMAFNAGSQLEIDPRPVDNASPGIGSNLNPDAVDYAPLAAITLAGNYVAPKRIVDQEYPAGLKAYLLTLPWATLENETIFAPSFP